MTEEDRRKELVAEVAKLRREKGITQKQLEKLSGVKQPVIARIETGAAVPQISTVIKLLAPFGKTLAIVPLHEAK